jgi:hypothetical protein
MKKRKIILISYLMVGIAILFVYREYLIETYNLKPLTSEEQKIKEQEWNTTIHNKANNLQKLKWIDINQSMCEDEDGIYSVPQYLKDLNISFEVCTLKQKAYPLYLKVKRLCEYQGARLPTADELWYISKSCDNNGTDLQCLINKGFAPYNYATSEHAHYGAKRGGSYWKYVDMSRASISEHQHRILELRVHVRCIGDEEKQEYTANKLENVRKYKWVDINQTLCEKENGTYVSKNNNKVCKFKRLNNGVEYQIKEQLCKTLDARLPSSEDLYYTSLNCPNASKDICLVEKGFIMPYNNHISAEALKDNSNAKNLNKLYSLRCIANE